MAWSTPMTAVSNATFTAAQFNASVRDNLLETAVAKATAGGQIFVSTAANALAARTPISQTVSPGTETTTSTSYAAMPSGTAGPAVTATTGTAALVSISSKMTHSTNTAEMFAAYAISGATTVASSDTNSISLQPATAAGNSIRVSAVILHTGLTAGSNTFTMQYRVTAGTGSYDRRHLAVVPF